MTDSAGVPWAGRRFEPNPAAGDDGEPDPRLLAALEAFRAGAADLTAVVAAVGDARLLVPLLTEAGIEGLTPEGRRVDKTQELALVTVQARDGRRVLPAFTSVAAMRRWNPQARPVPVAGRRVALAAAAEGTELVVLDPVSPTEAGLRRPARWAIPPQHNRLPSYLDEEVLGAFLECAADQPVVRLVQLAPGDPQARLTGPELIVQLGLAPGLDRAELDGHLALLQERWAAHPVIADRVDSIGVQLVEIG